MKKLINYFLNIKYYLFNEKFYGYRKGKEKGFLIFFLKKDFKFDK